MLRASRLFDLSFLIRPYSTSPSQSCIESASRMFPKQGTSEKAKKATEDLEEMEDTAFEPIDVLVDAIIGYLEKSTAYMRSVSNQVFALLSGSVKGTTIDLIVTVSLLLPLSPSDQR